MRTIAVVAALALAPAAKAACGPTNYAYAGVSSIEARAGIAARISALEAPDVAAGHVAAWVGVGGYGLGPAGANEWLQAGISVRKNQDAALYYEVALPGAPPRYVMLKGHLPLGRDYDVAVLESRLHPGWWRVWVDGSRMTDRIFLPGSHGAWRPTATVESWNGDRRGTCNAFAFAFWNVRVATAPGGAWEPIRGPISADGDFRVRRQSTNDVVAVSRG